MASMPKDTKLSLANKIRISRRQLGLSQREFGKAINLTDKAISAYEVGRAAPNISVLQKISALTNKPVGYFIEERGTGLLQVQMRLKVVEDEFKEIKKILDNLSPDA
jgi:transcriptional regulator with XRE-family HTH domain